VFTEAKDDGGGRNNWSYKMCKSPVKLSSPTNQHPTFYRPNALPVTQPTVSEYLTALLILVFIQPVYFPEIIKG